MILKITPNNPKAVEKDYPIHASEIVDRVWYMQPISVEKDPDFVTYNFSVDGENVFHSCQQCCVIFHRPENSWTFLVSPDPDTNPRDDTLEISVDVETISDFPFIDDL